MTDCVSLPHKYLSVAMEQMTVEKPPRGVHERDVKALAFRSSIWIVSSVLLKQL